MNQDLKEERQKIAFNVEEFTNWYYGGADNVKEKRFYENYFLNDPELQNEPDMSYMSHTEKYEEGVRKGIVVLRKLKQLQKDGYGDFDIISKAAFAMTSVLREGSPMSLQYSMFLPAIYKLGTVEQQAEWATKAWNLSIIGTYAQTELGHGTFVRGLETIATYDPKTKEFVMHSPTITAYKWWPGNLGHTVNYAIVMAQLYSLGKNHGIHAFLVQLRDEETHKPLKGITIGEIGNKVGYNTVNNGFLGFDHVRIPLKNMLMRNAKVSESGEFQREQSSVLNYGTMTHVRVGIVRDQAFRLSTAVTIAMRYSIVRHQSPIDPSLPEPSIIEHVTQQMKIFPAIAKALAIKSAADNLSRMYVEVTSEIEKGNLVRLPELHALSCCLKSVSTNETLLAVETCRLACGGHGYLISSGLNDIYKNVAAAQHYEGDNTVLLLQTARFLIKAWEQSLKGKKLTPTVNYLEKYVKRSGDQREDWNESINGILRALETTTAGIIASAYANVEERKKYFSAEEATNQTGVELTKAAELHYQVFLLQSIILMFENGAKNSSSALAVVFEDILELYAVDLTIRYLGNLLQVCIRGLMRFLNSQTLLMLLYLLFVNITNGDIKKLHIRLETGLRRFRKHAIGIVDGFDFSDSVLGSTLGAYDGNVYERLLKAAKKSPLNQEDVNKSFHLHLKPFMKSNL